MVLDWLDEKPSEQAFDKLAESVAFEYLNRKFKRLGYIRNKNGEVDFYKHSAFGIEVKWQPVVKNASETYKQLRTPFKSIWSQTNFLKELPPNNDPLTYLIL
jgi:predicted AAA+ superfamily ATPase